VTKLSKRVIVAEAERNQLEQEVSELRDKLGVMKREHNETLIECSSKLGINEHKTSLVEIKRFVCYVTLCYAADDDVVKLMNTIIVVSCK